MVVTMQTLCLVVETSLALHVSYTCFLSIHMSSQFLSIGQALSLKNIDWIAMEINADSDSLAKHLIGLICKCRTILLIRRDVYDCVCLSRDL